MYTFLVSPIDVGVDQWCADVGRWTERNDPSDCRRWTSVFWEDYRLQRQQPANTCTGEQTYSRLWGIVFHLRLFYIRDGPNVRLWHLAKAEGLGRLTEWVPNVRPNAYNCFRASVFLAYLGYMAPFTRSKFLKRGVWQDSDKKHYSDEVENIYVTLRQIYLGHYIPNIVLGFIEDVTKMLVYFSIHGVDMWARFWLIEQGLTSHQTHCRSYRGRFLQVIWPNQQCQSTEGNQMVFQIRPESHQDHSTMLQYYNSRQPPLRMV